MEINIKQISSFNSEADKCNSDIYNICGCLLHPFHSMHHTNFEEFLDDETAGTEGVSAYLYLTGHDMCHNLDGQHSRNVEGICYSPNNIASVVLQSYTIDTKRIIYHELFHLFGVHDHVEEGGICTYAYNSSEICTNCTKRILKNIGRYKSNSKN